MKTLTPKELAQRWNMHVGTLANWRSKGKGPKFIKIGPKKVYYRINDVIEYESENVYDPSLPIEVLQGKVCEFCREELDSPAVGYPQTCKRCANGENV